MSIITASQGDAPEFIELVEITLNLILVSIKVLEFFFQFCDLGLKILDMSLHDLFLRLDELCFLFLIFDVSLNFFTKFDLNNSDSFFIFALHFCDDLLIHSDHFGQ